jgi:hypothetical protein
MASALLWQHAMAIAYFWQYTHTDLLKDVV